MVVLKETPPLKYITAAASYRIAEYDNIHKVCACILYRISLCRFLVITIEHCGFQNKSFVAIYNRKKQWYTLSIWKDHNADNDWGTVPLSYASQYHVGWVAGSALNFHSLVTRNSQINAVGITNFDHLYNFWGFDLQYILTFSYAVLSDNTGHLN